MRASRSAGEGPGGMAARTFPAAPSAPSRREWKGEVGGGSESILATFYAMVAQAQYVPNQTFLALSAYPKNPDTADEGHSLLFPLLSLDKAR